MLSHSLTSTDISLILVSSFCLCVSSLVACTLSLKRFVKYLSLSLGCDVAGEHFLTEVELDVILIICTCLHSVA